jgi:hypothetical protein
MALSRLEMRRGQFFRLHVSLLLLAAWWSVAFVSAVLGRTASSPMSTSVQNSGRLGNQSETTFRAYNAPRLEALCTSTKKERPLEQGSWGVVHMFKQSRQELHGAVLTGLFESEIKFDHVQIYP